MWHLMMLSLHYRANNPTMFKVTQITFLPYSHARLKISRTSWHHVHMAKYTELPASDWLIRFVLRRETGGLWVYSIWGLLIELILFSFTHKLLYLSVLQSLTHRCVHSYSSSQRKSNFWFWCLFLSQHLCDNSQSAVYVEPLRPAE